MGVGGHFWELLKPHARYEGFDFLRDKRVAVDLSYWIVQQQTAIKTAVRKPYLRITFFRTINLFSMFGAFPVFVIDGCPSHLKSRARMLRSIRAGGSGGDAVVSPKTNEISVERSQQFTKYVEECMELLRYLGMPVLKARGEAEALCAQLNRDGFVDACITADSDAFLYGAKCVIKSINPHSREPFECYNIVDIEAGLGLKRNQMIAISLLVGSDLDLNGVHGVGLETAVRFARSANDDEILNRLHNVGCEDDQIDATHDASSDDQMDTTHDAQSDDAISSSKTSSTDRRSSHCSLCGHPGSKRLHVKVACELCMISSAQGCSRKSIGFKCYCSTCDGDRKKKDSERERNWWVRVRDMISAERNFPNPEILSIYLSDNHGFFDVIEGPSMSWMNPRTDMVVDFLVFHQLWKPSYIRLKMIPILSTIFLRETGTNPKSRLLNEQFEFDGIEQSKIRFGRQLYRVKWKRVSVSSPIKIPDTVPEDHDSGLQRSSGFTDESIDEDSSSHVVDVGGGSTSLVTDENTDLVRAAFPDEVFRFLHAEEMGQSRRRSSGSKSEKPESKEVQLRMTQLYPSRKTIVRENEKEEGDVEKPRGSSPPASPSALMPVRRPVMSPPASVSVRRRLCFD